MEPDHAGSIAKAVEEFPEMKIVGNAKTFTFMGQFFDLDIDAKKVVVAEGDELALGAHTLKFVMAPMVHWPEVMMSYEMADKVLFSADGFGKFGALDAEEDWACEARRYYFNIVGKYGTQVTALLTKAAMLDIKMVCPLHGFVWRKDIGYFIDKYLHWASYTPEENAVMIAAPFSKTREPCKDPHLQKNTFATCV